jgi:hypothetical protein
VQLKNVLKEETPSKIRDRQSPNLVQRDIRSISCRLVNDYGNWDKTSPVLQMLVFTTAKLMDDAELTRTIRAIQGSSSLSPMQGREPISARPKEPPDLQSSKDSPMQADLDIAFSETVEASTSIGRNLWRWRESTLGSRQFSYSQDLSYSPGARFLFSFRRLLPPREEHCSI